MNALRLTYDWTYVLLVNAWVCWATGVVIRDEDMPWELRP